MTFLGNLISFIFVRKTRLWQKSDTIEQTTPLAKTELAPEKTTNEMAPTKSELEKLATVLDTGGTMDTDQATSAREINTLPAKKKIDNSLVEQELGVEDIFEQTDI